MKLSFENKWLTITGHIIIWIVVFSLPYLLHHSYDNIRPGEKIRPLPPFNVFTVLLNLIWVGLFYLNANLLVPVLINRRRYLAYTGTVLAAFFMIMLLHWMLFTEIIPQDIRGKRVFTVLHFIDFNIALFILTLAVSIAYRMIADKIQADKLEKEKQEENMKTELSFLRSQISPHFMFNVLNNIIALARLKSDKLEPTIFKLSSLMRYMLYQSDEKKVPLKKEIEYLQSYIDLQRLRFGDKIGITLSVDIADDQLEIEPMLLIPFVENAFKHGTTYITEPRIEIELSLANRQLDFRVSNKFSHNKEETQDETSGIGLVNVQRRLKLLYRQDHELHILQKDDWFSVSLQLKLHDVTVYSH